MGPVEEPSHRSESVEDPPGLHAGQEVLAGAAQDTLVIQGKEVGHNGVADVVTEVEEDDVVGVEGPHTVQVCLELLRLAGAGDPEVDNLHRLGIGPAVPEVFECGAHGVRVTDASAIDERVTEKRDPRRSRRFRRAYSRSPPRIP